MRKKFKLFIIVLALVLASGGTALAMGISNYMEEKKQDEALLEQNEKAPITELFHDQGHIYMTPEEPKQGETVTLRLRTVRYNVTRAQIQYTPDRGESWKTADMEFEKKDDTGYYDIWKGEFQAEGDLLYYRFIVSNKDMFNTVYFDLRGINITEQDYGYGWQIVPDHTVAKWAKGALWYSLTPDAFYNGNTVNDKQNSGETTYATWNNLHKGLADRYGGDLDGVEGKLDYIKDLGVNALFINPVFKSYHNVGNRSVRFDEIESSYGNEQDLLDLVDAVHEHDMYIITDVITTFADTYGYYFNKENRWPVVGAAQSKDSEWYEMFDFFNWPDHYLTAWDQPALDYNSEPAKNLLYANDDSSLRKYAKIFDGYRFDCGGWLWGKTETDELKAYDIIKKVKQALREVDDDFLVMSEADGPNMNTNTWDSDFNVSYQPKLQDYAKGLINETLMTEAMWGNNIMLPRNVALARYNPVCYHDTYRVVQNDDYMYNAAILIQMTYIGSPCIFYGEEVNFIRQTEEGVGTIQSFYGMDWDESNWDYDRLNFYKATGELRKTYSCVKTGVVNLLGYDNEQNTITFGRWDDKGAAITVTSQNKDVIQVEIPVRKCDIVDGTIMTDWYTGKQYKVENGMIQAEVMPGGTVFVTGKNASSYRQGFQQEMIGNAKKGEITSEDTGSFSINGKGTIEKRSDKIFFANTKAYDDFSVFANIKGNGKGSLLIRGDMEADGMYYGVIVDGNKLSVLTRTQKGKKATTLATVSCDQNTYVKLERMADNTFCAYVTEVSDGNLGTWKEIKDSRIQINMGNQVYYGFAPLKNKMKVSNITFKQTGNKSTFDDFDTEVRTSLFDNINADFVSVEDGKLNITNSAKEKLHYLLTNSQEDDWTFKTKLIYSAKQDSYAGVICQQDANNSIVAGRTVADGVPVLFIGKEVNGKLAIYGYVKDPVPEKAVIVQLQRIGAYYSAVYSDDDGITWSYIGRLYTNFSNERVGVVVSGNAKASYDWVSFGDSIHDGVSVNTPQSPVDVDTTYTNDSTLEECQYRYLSGDWSVVAEGWHQNDKTGFAQAAAVNKFFTDLSIEVTLKLESGDGWAGLAFGKTTPESDAKDGFLLKYYKDGNVSLVKDNRQIGECRLDTSGQKAMRFSIEVSGEKVVVYAGQNAAPVLVVYDTGYKGGYVSFCTDGAAADFMNFHHGSANASWNWISEQGFTKRAGSGKNIMMESTDIDGRPIHSIATFSGYSFTNFVTTAKLYVEKLDEETATASGLLLCASEGKSAMADGVLVYVDGNGKLGLSVEGKVIAEYQMPENETWADIMVVKQNGRYQVFLKDVESPVLEYAEDFNRGGVLSVYTINGSASFSNIDIENLQASQDYKETRVAKAWLSDTKEDVSVEYFNYNQEEGTFYVKDGVLSCQDITGYGAGASIVNDIYDDFTMDFKVRLDRADNGWMAVGLRKGYMNESHMDAGVALMISSGGNVFFYPSTTREETSLGTIPGFETGKWYDIKIVAKGATISAYVNGQKVASYTDTQFHEGFISFSSGMQPFSVDDLQIRKIK